MNSRYKNLGLIITGAFNYALYPVIIVILAFSKFNDGMGVEQTFAWGFMLVGIKELFNLLVHSTVFGFINWKKYNFWQRMITPLYYIYETWSEYIRTKGAWLIVLGSFLAGPIGYSLETIGIFLADPSIGTLFISLLPIWILIGRFLSKESRPSSATMMSVAVIVISVSLNGLLQVLFKNNNYSSTNMIIALMLGLITGFLWSLENILVSIATKRGAKVPVDRSVALKLSSAALIIPALLMPMVNAITGQGVAPYHWYSNFFTNPVWFGSILIVGFIMFLARFLYFFAIRKLNTTSSSMIIVVRLAFVPIFQVIFFTIFHHDWSIRWDIFVPLSIITWIGLYVLIHSESRVEQKLSDYDMFHRKFKDRFIDRIFKDDEFYSSKFRKLKNRKNTWYNKIIVGRFVTKRNSAISSDCIFENNFKICHGLSGVFLTKYTFKGNVMIQQNVTIGVVGTNENEVGYSKGNLYIGAGAFIANNVVIGENVIIGANSVVTKDVPSNTTVVGVNHHLHRPDNKNKILKIFKR